MNCKQGDLAIIVRSYAGNEGKIVRCLEFLGYQLWEGLDGRMTIEPTWRVDCLLPGWGGDCFLNEISDDLLRPIRGTEGEDEVLRYAGKPESVTA